MAVKMGIYKCGICGNLVEVIDAGKGDLVCCGEPMTLITENTVEASKEKHIPVIEKTADVYIVKVGSIPHPMEEKHFIEWISVCADNRTYRKFLKPGDAPEATFCIKADKIVAHAYCNIHGLWKS